MYRVCCVSQLAYCVVQFLEKDPTLTEPVPSSVLFGLNHSTHAKHEALRAKSVNAVKHLATTHLNTL